MSLEFKVTVYFIWVGDFSREGHMSFIDQKKEFFMPIDIEDPDLESQLTKIDKTRSSWGFMASVGLNHNLDLNL